MRIRDAPRLFLSSLGILRSGPTAQSVTLHNDTIPLEDNDVNKLRSNQRVKMLELNLVSDRGIDLVLANESVDLNLSRQEWLSEYHQMRNDDAVRDALNLLLGGLWNVQYYAIPAGEDRRELQAAAYLSDQLGLGRPSFSKYQNFRTLLKAYEHALVYGFSAVEIVLADDGQLDKLVPIHPFHIREIQRDRNGGPQTLVVEGMVKAGETQNSNYTQVKLPFVKVVYFAHDDDGNLDGRSILRPAYVPWRIKRSMLKLVNAGYERFLLGIPVLTVPKTVVPGTKEWNMAESTLKTLSAKPRSGVALPEGWQLEIYTVNSQMPDALPYIVRQDLAIKRAMGVSYAALGQDAAGSNYKQSEGLAAASDRAVRELAQEFLDYVNLYLVNKLIYLNFPQLKRYPYLGILNQRAADASSLLNAYVQMLAAAQGKDGFNPDAYQQLVELAPPSIRNLMGFEEDRLYRLVEQYRRSV